jgi:hypothetical protein
MTTRHHSNCRCPKLAPVPQPRVEATVEPQTTVVAAAVHPVADPPPGCFCAQPWGSVLPPPPCPHHTTTLAWYGGVHALERSLLRKLLGASFLAHTDASPRLFFSCDWVDLSPAEAALLQSLEL